MTGRLAVLAVTLATFLTAADPQWLRLQTPGFEVYTSAGVRSGREALRLLTEIRHVFAARTGQQELTILPVRIFVFRSESEFRPFQVIGGAAGYYQAGTDRDYIAMLASGASFPRVVFHEYVHLMMRHAGVQAPVWLNEGTAEVYSTTELHGNEVRIGDVIAGHLATLRSQPMLDLDVLLRVQHDSPQYNERDKTGIFYAQSWALAHMLNFAPSYQPGFPHLIAALESGDEPPRAFQRAFGKSLAAVRADLDTYIRQARFTGVRFRTERLENQAKAAVVDPVPSTEATLALHDLLLAVRREDEAGSMLERLAKAHPDHPGVQSALGDAALRRRDSGAAMAHYRRAMEMGNESGRIRYEHAVVLRETGATEEEVIRWLDDAVRRDPILFDAHYLRGYLALQAGRSDEAVASLSRAADLRPLEGNVWEHLALAHHRSGNREQARAAATRARKLATKEEEVARTEGLLRLVESDADNIVKAVPLISRDIPGHKARTTPHGRLTGSMVQVDCLREKARLHVLAETGKVLLLVRNPGEVVLRNSGAAWEEFRCGAVPSRSVAIDFRPVADSRFGTAGEVVAIEFR